METDTKTTMVNALDLWERLEAMRVKAGLPKDRKQIMGENLERIRKAQGISRKTLAELGGMTEVGYGAYERGIKALPLEKIFLYADFLKVPVIDLIGESSETSGCEYLEYRLRRAIKLANLAKFSIYPLNNGTVEMEMYDKREFNKNLNADESGVVFTQWSRVIPIKSIGDFVRIIEKAQEFAIKENITFDNAIKNLLDDVCKKYETEWHKKFDSEIKRGEENDVPDVAQKP